MVNYAGPAWQNSPSHTSPFTVHSSQLENMPIYEYKCKDCGECFEKRQTLSDEPLKSCEKCGGGLEKQWSLSGFQFKGGGWYVTDYAGKKSGTPETSTKSEKASGGESTEKSSDASKPTTDTKSPVKDRQRVEERIDEAICTTWLVSRFGRSDRHGRSCTIASHSQGRGSRRNTV